MKRPFYKYIIIIIFGLFGLVFGGIGIGFVVHDLPLFLHGVEVDGTITDVSVVRSRKDGHTSRSYYPTIQFQTADGKTILYHSAVNDHSAKEGEMRRVVYDPQNPQLARIKGADQYLVPAIFGGFGLVFGSIAAGFAINLWRRRQFYKWLQTNGVKVKGRIDDIVQNTSVRVNRRSPYILHVEWEGSGDTYIFESESLWERPNIQIGDSIEVLIDPANPKRYYVITDNLTPKNIVDLTT